MLKESEIRKQLNNYLANQQSFEALEDWLVENSREQYLSNAPSVRSLYQDIDYLIFQFIEGQIAESRFKDGIRALVQRPSEIVFTDRDEPLVIR